MYPQLKELALQVQDSVYEITKWGLCGINIYYTQCCFLVGNMPQISLQDIQLSCQSFTHKIMRLSLGTMNVCNVN